MARRQLLAMGVSPDMIDRRVKAGAYIPVYRGVYAVGHEALTWRGRATAALLAVGSSSVISHRSAAAAWRMLPAGPGPIEVSVVGRRLRSRPDIVIHRPAALDPRDVRDMDRVRVTSPARTAVDLARVGGPRLDVALAEAQVLRLVTRRGLEAAMARATDPRGLPELRRRLDAGNDAPTRSALERAMLRLVADAGLPGPLVNARVGRFEVDFLWRDERVIVETDGWVAHRHRGAFEGDRARDAELQAAGYLVVRFTWRQITETRLLVATRIAQVLAARG